MLKVIEQLWMCSNIYSDVSLELVKSQANEIDRYKLTTPLYVSWRPSMLRDLDYIITGVLKV